MATDRPTVRRSTVAVLGVLSLAVLASSVLIVRNLLLGLTVVVLLTVPYFLWRLLRAVETIAYERPGRADPAQGGAEDRGTDPVPEDAE